MSWTEHISKTHNKKFYVHSSGKTQWHEPNEEIEADKELILNYYKINKHHHSFLQLIKASIYYEFTHTFRSQLIFSDGFTVLDLGCGDEKDYDIWKQIGCVKYTGMDILCGLDFTNLDYWNSLKNEKFDVVTCSFAAQYAFCDIHSAKIFIRGIIGSLSKNGIALLIVREHDGTKLYGDRYLINGNLPEWWVQEESIRPLLTPDVEMLTSANLAKIATWIGYQSLKLSFTRTLEFFVHHRALVNELCPLISAMDWKTASEYKLIIIRKKNSLNGKNYENEIKLI